MLIAFSQEKRQPRLFMDKENKQLEIFTHAEMFSEIFFTDLVLSIKQSDDMDILELIDIGGEG
jgi:hypothetical protein